MSTLSPIATVRGTVRAAVPLTRKDDTTYGTRLTVLTEPEAGFIDVTAFESTLSIPEAKALEGASVELAVTLRARAWKSADGGAHAALDVVLQNVLQVPAPASA